MPPCGNFGLAYIPADEPISNSYKTSSNEAITAKNYLDRRHHTDVDLEEAAASKKSSSVIEDVPISVLPLLNILQGQAAWTEFRGGFFHYFILFYFIFIQS